MIFLLKIVALNLPICSLGSARLKKAAFCLPESGNTYKKEIITFFIITIRTWSRLDGFVDWFCGKLDRLRPQGFTTIHDLSENILNYRNKGDMRVSWVCIIIIMVRTLTRLSTITLMEHLAMRTEISRGIIKEK